MLGLLDAEDGTQDLVYAGYAFQQLHLQPELLRLLSLRFL